MIVCIWELNEHGIMSSTVESQTQWLPPNHRLTSESEQEGPWKALAFKRGSKMSPGFRMLPFPHLSKEALEGHQTSNSTPDHPEPMRTMAGLMGIKLGSHPRAPKSDFPG